MMRRVCIWVAAAFLSCAPLDVRANEPAIDHAAVAAALLANPSTGSEALHDAGDRAYRAKAYDEAFKLFQRAADRGHATSMRRLALLHLYGQGTARDPAKSREIYLAAAKLGDAIAMNEFASMAARGWNGPQDAPAAIEWATRAVEAGNHAAISVLGSIYENGLGVPRDLAKAIEWYDRGADKNNVYKDSAQRLREAARTTPAQKLAAYETDLREAEKHNNPSLARGHAVARYLRSLYDGGLSPEEAAERFRPELEKLVATDFHAVAQGMRLATPTLSEPVQALLSADQRLVIRQINFPRSFRTAAEIQPGQGWSAVYSADKRPAAATTAAVAAVPAPQSASGSASAVAAKPAPAPAPRPASPPVPRAPTELSAITREAKNWQEFFAASARRGTPFFVRHETDVNLFLKRHPADAEQLRTAYRAAFAALQPTVGTDRGSEVGAQFVAYLLAVRGSGLAAADVLPWVRNDFLNLARSDTYNAHHALMGVPTPDVRPLRDLLPPAQSNEVGAIAASVTRREVLPKVGEPAAASARVAATASAPASSPQGLPDAPGFNARRGSTTSLAGHWALSTHITGGQRVTGDVRFEGSDGIVNAIVFDPLSNSPRRSSAGVTGAGITMPGQPNRGTLNFQLGNLTYTGSFNPPNLSGNIIRDGQIAGNWSATRRIDLDYYAIARSAQGPAAIAAYTSAIRLNPLPRYYLDRGNLHYDARNNEAAIADYDAAIQAEPGNAIARFNRMLALYYARQHERALAEVNHLLDKKMVRGEQLAHAHFMRGEILWWLKRGEESEAAYAAAIKLDPKFAERTRAANTREGRFAEIAESAARTNEIMNRMDEGIRRSTDQLRAANQASLNASSAPADPATLAETLYARLAANLASPGQKGAALTADQQAVFAELDRLLPLAARSAAEDFNRRNADRNRSAPAADTFIAGVTAWRENRTADALRLFEQAASAGHPAAKANLANYFARAVGDLPALPVARRQQLLLEAHAGGSPHGSAGLVNLFLDQKPADFAEALKWARASDEMGDPEGGYAFYYVVLQSRYALQRDPMRALEASKPETIRVQREELDQALAALRKSALRGVIYAKYELARYHYAGGLPGVRRGFSFSRPEHNLHLARFWFEQARKHDANTLSESAREEIPKVVAAIDRALAAAKGREWTADDIIAALESGLPADHVSWLLAREGGTYTRSQYTRILTAEAFRKIPEQSLLRDRLGAMVLIGPGKEATALAAAAVAERRRTVSPLPDLGTDVAELRRRFEAGDPAAAYALLELIPRQNQGAWPEGSPPTERVREVAISRDYAPAQYLRIQIEKLDAPNLATRDLPRAFALALSSARAGSPDAARLVADYYREHRSDSPVRPNLVEAEWWYAQSVALSRPDQYTGFAGLLDPQRSLASLYQFQTPGMGGGFSFDVRHPAVHRWARELRARGGDAKLLADEIVAYFGTSDAGSHDLEKFIAALPAALPPIAPAELARLEREAAAGQPEALRTLTRALAHGEGGLRQDDARAAALYRRAAEAGDREAMSAFAEILEKGYGVRADLVATLEWRARAEGKPVDRAAILVDAARAAAREIRTHPLVEPYLREAIQLGSAKAMTSLGHFLRDGRVMPKDAAAGLRLIEQGAEAGDVSAMTTLAYFFRDEKEGAVDLAASHRWFVRAAEAGDKNAISALVHDFEQGRNGAPRDPREALRWARLAAPDNATIRTIVLPRLENAVGGAADPGATAFDRAATLTGEAQRAALREAARHSHVEATSRLLDLLLEARLWHEAHWWATRHFMIERDDSAKVRAMIEGQADFKVAKLPKDVASAVFDEPLEKSLPILAEALQRCGSDRRRLIAQLDQIIDRHADRAEPLIAKAQLTLDQPATARELLDRAVKFAPAHPQAHALLARLEASAGQPYRAYYRLTEVRTARPNSLMLAAAQAELLHALGGDAAERQKERHSVHYILKRLPADYSPADRFAALVAAAKLAVGMEAWAEAEADLSAALQLNRDPRLLLERAQVRERLKAYPGAIADYTAVLASPLGQNPQQAPAIRARLEAVQKAMNAETVENRKTLPPAAKP